jgi:hypothetical protein
MKLGSLYLSTGISVFAVLCAVAIIPVNAENIDGQGGKAEVSQRLRPEVPTDTQGSRATGRNTFGRKSNLPRNDKSMQDIDSDSVSQDPLEPAK